MLKYFLKSVFILLLIVAFSPVNANKKEGFVPPDFNQYTNAHLRSKAFIHFMLPIIQQAQINQFKTRKLLLHYSLMWQQKGDKAHLPNDRLMEQAELYRLENPNFNKENTWKQLITKVDLMPTSLILAQAINESNWGRSRFAREGKNYFGQHCYTQACGIAPIKRPVGSRLQVKKYPSVLASVEDYLDVLNSRNAYRQMRKIRGDMRAHNRPINSLQLIQGLTKYSVRGQAYVNSLKQIIKTYNLRQYDKKILAGNLKPVEGSDTFLEWESWLHSLSDV